VTTSVKATSKTKLKFGTLVVEPASYIPAGWSAQGHAKGSAVLAGYGLQDAELGLDDFKGLDVKGKVVVVRRFAPEHERLSTVEAQRKAGDLRRKAFVVRSLGAKALLIVDWPLAGKPKAPPSEAHGASAASASASPSASLLPLPSVEAASRGAHVASDASLPSEARLPALRPEGSGDAGLPVMIVKRAAFESVWRKLERKQRVEVELDVELAFEKTDAFIVVGLSRGGKAATEGTNVVGGNYDHLGFGGLNSLAPDKHAAHLGADDNASGTATLLEIARTLAARREQLTHDVIIAAFSGEEDGVLGSSALVNAKPEWLKSARAMLNLDMVGRLRMNTLNILGSESASEWNTLITDTCAAHRMTCKPSGDGYGPSDHTPFYAAGMPVLHFFTGAHSDYHKPSDEPSKLNFGGMSAVAGVVSDVVLAAQASKLTLRKVPAPASRGDARSFNASLGTIPDYGGPPPGLKGVLLADVRPGGGADLAGMRRGDVLVRLGKHDIGSVEDLMFVLQQAKPGESVGAIVIRNQAEVTLETTFQEGRKR
jgi:hypothetical protein